MEVNDSIHVVDTIYLVHPDDGMLITYTSDAWWEGMGLEAYADELLTEAGEMLYKAQSERVLLYHCYRIPQDYQYRWTRDECHVLLKGFNPKDDPKTIVNRFAESSRKYPIKAIRPKHPFTDQWLAYGTCMACHGRPNAEDLEHGRFYRAFYYVYWVIVPAYDEIPVVLCNGCKFDISHIGFARKVAERLGMKEEASIHDIKAYVRNHTDRIESR